MNHRLTDLIDVEQFQMLQDRLNEVYSFPSAIIDNDGIVLTATAWQDLCTRFHRQHPECLADCIASDRYIIDHLHEANPAVSYRCPRGLIDNATPIIIDGQHLGNFFTGQFFLEPPDLGFFREQAERYGFEADAYLAAVQAVPVWSQQQLESYLFFIKGLIEIIASIGLKNLRALEAREQAAESESQLRVIFEKASLGMTQADPHTGRWLRVNQRMCEITGYSAEELLAKSVAEITHPDDQEADRRAYERAVRSKAHDYRLEKRYVRKDGEVVWVNVNISVMWNAAGQPMRTMAVVEDITDRRRAAEERSANQDLHRSILQTAMSGFWLTDTQGQLLEVNDAYCRMSGYTAQELLNLRIPDLEANESPAETALHMARLMATGEDRFETKHRRRDGSVFDVEISMQYRPVEGGRCVVFLSDITERKRAEQAQRRNEAMLRGILDNLQDAYVRADADRLITMVSPSAARLFGYDSTQEMIGLPISALYSADTVRRDVAERLARHGHIEDYVGQARRKDGSAVWVSANMQLFRDEDGNVEAMEGVVRDITERRMAEQAVRESESRFRAVFESSVDAIGVAHSGHLVLVSQAFVALFGYDNADQLVGCPARELIARDEQERVADMVRRRLAGEAVPRNFETRGRRKDGSSFDLELHISPFDTGHEIMTLMVLRDVTERNTAVKALSHSRDLMRYVIEHNRSAVAVHDRDLNYVYVSQRYLDDYRVQDPNLIGRHHYDVFPDLPQKWRDVHQRALRGEVLSAEDDPWPRDDGTTDWTRWECRPWYEADGSIGGIIIYTELITDRILAEEARRASESRARAMYDAMPDLMFRLDRDGVFLDYKADTTDLYAQSLPSLVGLRNRDLVPPAFADLIDERIRETLTTGHMCTFEYTLPVSGRGERHYEARMVPSGPDEVLAMVRDVTERKSAEEEREQLTAQLAQAQKMESVGRLAGGVAHDFNNMLSVILGHVEIALEETEPGHPLHDDMVSIQDAALRSADLTAQLLAFARKQTVSPQVLDLNNAVVGLLRMVARLIGENIELSFRPAADLWPIWMDLSQMSQVLTNLCVNARDAIEGVGRITIETGNAVATDLPATHAELTESMYVRLTLTDNGCGMDEETLGHIFEPFFTTKGQGRGTGLGLATVYGIVKQNNGFIDVTSEPGQGSRFSIYLPRHHEQATPVPVEDPSGRAATAQATVLLVEDEPAVLRLTVRQLERQGYRVLSAGSPAEAMRLANDHDGAMDLLLTDVIMPEMNGRDLATALQVRYPRLKCLYMSGYTADIISSHGALADDLHFIEKPFSGWALAAKITEVLRGD